MSTIDNRFLYRCITRQFVPRRYNLEPLVEAAPSTSLQSCSLPRRCLLVERPTSYIWPASRGWCTTASSPGRDMEAEHGVAIYRLLQQQHCAGSMNKDVPCNRNKGWPHSIQASRDSHFELKLHIVNSFINIEGHSKGTIKIGKIYQLEVYDCKACHAQWEDSFWLATLKQNMHSYIQMQNSKEPSLKHTSDAVGNLVDDNLVASIEGSKIGKDEMRCHRGSEGHNGKV